MIKIGIIGAGQIGRALAKKLVKAGYPVIISNSRGPETLNSLIPELGTSASAGTSEAAAGADVVILAVGWLRIPELLIQLQEQLRGKIVIDVSNYFPEDGKFIKLDKPTGVTVSKLIPESKVVKAFNHLYGKWIEADPAVENGKRVSFISGNDAQANGIVGEIISACGFEVIELGSLEQGGAMTDVGGALSGLNLVSFPI
jgi:predicted dinucleotide-binding enzyme